MPNPQKENGFTPIANEIMDAMVRYRLPGEQMQCLLCVLRKTYGFNKKTDKISLSQFVRATGMKRPNVARAVKGLIDKNILHVKKGGIKKDTIKVSEYRFNKRYDTWKSGIKKDTGGIKKDNRVVSKKIHTKDTITKDTINIVVDHLNKKTNSSYKPNAKATVKKVNARIKDGFSPDDFFAVIDFKSSQWLGDKEMQQYLRPDTLFGTKFESYLEAARKAGFAPKNGSVVDRDAVLKAAGFNTNPHEATS